MPARKPNLSALMIVAVGLLSASAMVLTAQDARAQDAILTQERFAFAPEYAYDVDIPTPSEVLDYEPGTQYTLYSDVVRYIHALAKASDRVSIHPYGSTHEGRPLHYLVVTSPQNHGQIEAIREANLKLADPSVTASEANELVANQPVVTWLSYNVHGNEASSTEAAMQVAYTLAAAQNDDVAAWLEHSVVIIDPTINPDGRDRYVYWYRSTQRRVLSLSADDLEHDEPWPGGRTNHYWFDLNRDWTWLVHPESQGRIAAYQSWLPQVHVDYHEQGYNSNYFTMPGQSPRNLNLPDAYDDWAEVFGRANADAFDRHQINYFTREAFDFFYPGYGSSYPSNFGAIGMLTEQGGHSRGGRAVTTNDGYVLTLRQRIFDHFTTSLATIGKAAERRADLLSYFREFHTPGNTESATKAYFIRDDAGRGYAYDVIRTLQSHGVEVERADEMVDITAHDYWSGTASRQTFEPGTFVIKTDQARHVFINTLLQRQMAIEDSVMYDMATWSAPLAYNLDAAWTDQRVTFRTTLAGTVEAQTGLSNDDAAYAYVIDGDQRNALAALSQLWDLDYRVRAAAKPFSDGTTDFPAGSLIVLAGRNLERADRIARDMARVATDAGVEITGMDSGRMATGIDLASGNARPLKKPKAALLVDGPFSSYTGGQLWYLFDHWARFGVERVRASRLGGLAIDEYDVLILPAGNVGSVMDSAAVARLRAWVSRGGTLVATESAASFFTKGRSGMTNVELTKAAVAEEEDTDVPTPSAYTTYAARRDSSGLRRIPGSAIRGIVDTTHPLAFGVGPHVFSLKFSTDALEPSESLQTVGYYDTDAETALASGYASRKNLRKLAGKSFAAVQPIGSGNVVFLVDNTQYRMFWVGAARMVQNAVMIMPGF